MALRDLAREWTPPEGRLGRWWPAARPPRAEPAAGDLPAALKRDVGLSPEFVDYGPGAGLRSADAARLHRLAERLRTGPG